MGQATSGSCAVVHGTTIRGTAVLRFRNRNQLANRNNNIGFRVACVAASAPLVRVGRWEFTEGTRGVQPGSSDGGDFIQKSN